MAQRWLPHANGMRTRLDDSGDGSLRRLLRRQPGGDRGDVGVGQARRDPLHAVGLGGVALADAPARQLADDVGRAQADEAGNARLHAGQALAVAGDARRDRLGGIARCRRAPCRAPASPASTVGGVARRERRPLLGVVLGHLAQVGVGQVRDEVIHRRVPARAVAEGDELVVQVAGRLAGDAREVAVVRALAALPVAGDAALDARLHRIDLAERRHGIVLRAAAACNADAATNAMTRVGVLESIFIVGRGDSRQPARRFATNGSGPAPRFKSCRAAAGAAAGAAQA